MLTPGNIQTRHRFSNDVFHHLHRCAQGEYTRFLMRYRRGPGSDGRFEMYRIPLLLRVRSAVRAVKSIRVCFRLNIARKLCQDWFKLGSHTLLGMDLS